MVTSKESSFYMYCSYGNITVDTYMYMYLLVLQNLEG